MMAAPTEGVEGGKTVSRQLWAIPVTTVDRTS